MRTATAFLPRKACSTFSGSIKCRASLGDSMKSLALLLFVVLAGCASTQRPAQDPASTTADWAATDGGTTSHFSSTYSGSNFYVLKSGNDYVPAKLVSSRVGLPQSKEVAFLEFIAEDGYTIGLQGCSFDSRIACPGRLALVDFSHEPLAYLGSLMVRSAIADGRSHPGGEPDSYVIDGEPLPLCLLRNVTWNPDVSLVQSCGSWNRVSGGLPQPLTSVHVVPPQQAPRASVSFLAPGSDARIAGLPSIDEALVAAKEASKGLSGYLSGDSAPRLEKFQIAPAVASSTVPLPVPGFQAYDFGMDFTGKESGYHVQGKLQKDPARLSAVLDADEQTSRKFGGVISSVSLGNAFEAAKTISPEVTDYSLHLTGSESHEATYTFLFSLPRDPQSDLVEFVPFVGVDGYSGSVAGAQWPAANLSKLVRQAD